VNHRAFLARRRTDQVLDALSASAAPMTTHDVARAARLEPRETYAVLYQLLQDRQVQRGGGGRRAKPGEKQVRWRLAPEPPVREAEPAGVAGSPQ
jgi:DNA-binding IclR family transcriptional regulator